MSLTHVPRERRVVRELSRYPWGDADTYPVVLQKCDGTKPTCSRCGTRDRVCTYREEKSGQVLEQEVASLESRVREAELRRQTSPTLHDPLDRDNLPPEWWKFDEPPATMRPHL